MVFSVSRNVIYLEFILQQALHIGNDFPRTVCARFELSRYRTEYNVLS